MSIYELNIGYAAVLTAGGLIGYLKKGSLPSLAAGAGSGVIVGVATYMAVPGQSAIVAAISGGLSYVMGNKFVKTSKFMPAGLIAATSVVTFVAQLRQMYLTKSID